MHGSPKFDREVPFQSFLIHRNIRLSLFWPALQVLLAITAGALLVTPEWLTASLEAGEWLPEEPFLAKVWFRS